MQLMELLSEILKEHSKTQCTKLVNWVGDSQKRFDELFALFIEGEYRVCQRAAWPLSYCVINHPFIIKKHLSSLLKNLEKPGLHDAIKRNTLRLLQYVETPVKHHGKIMQLCFEYLQSATEPVAVKVFALTVLGNLAKKYPEIIPEIKLVIEEQLPNQTAAFKSRVNQFMKMFGTHKTDFP
jgi:hypothetical protein